VAPIKKDRRKQQLLSFNVNIINQSTLMKDYLSQNIEGLNKPPLHALKPRQPVLVAMP